MVLYTAKQTRLFENHVALAFGLAYPDHRPERGKVKIQIFTFFEIPRSASKNRRRAMELGDELPTKRPDLLNIAAAICDGLNGIAYADDAQITELQAWKRYSDKPRTEVVIDFYQDGQGA